MIGFIAARLAQSGLVLLVASVGLFALFRALPGDPAIVRAGPDATPAAVEAIRADLALDQPLPVQFVAWLKAALSGDLGESIVLHEAVTSVLQRTSLPTLELLAAALVLGVILGVAVGTVSAIWARRWPDVVLGGVAAGMIGFPVFWVGLLSIMVFAIWLPILPTGGYVSVFDDLGSGLQTLILPACVLALPLAGVLSRFVRSSVLETLSLPFVRTARSKGASEPRVISQHVMRNAAIPVVTMLGIQFGRLLGGAVVIETVFSWPGMGRLIIQSLGSRDYPLVQAALLYLIAGIAVLNLLVDISYGVIDPRVRR